VDCCCNYRCRSCCRGEFDPLGECGVATWGVLSIVGLSGLHLGEDRQCQDLMTNGSLNIRVVHLAFLFATLTSLSGQLHQNSNIFKVL
jgi:hypothetical protein